MNKENASVNVQHLMKQLRIKRIVENFLVNLDFCKEYNEPYSSITQSLSERLTVELFGVILDPKKGYAFDTNLNDELKSCEYIQPKTCKECDKKLNYFSEKCSCGCVDFNYNLGDSRWGINSVAHFKHLDSLNRYILFLVECKDIKTMTLNVKGWLIDKNNEHFNHMLYNQSKAKATVQIICHIVMISF